MIVSYETGKWTVGPIELSQSEIEADSLLSGKTAAELIELFKDEFCRVARLKLITVGVLLSETQIREGLQVS